jgi:TolB-like protein/Flp pilus assembly protein TadD
MSLFTELKRRNVFRVGIAYLIVAWLVMQVADVVLNNIAAPDWVFQAILLLLGIGLPLVLVFAWAFELTPDGLKRDRDVDRSQSIAPVTGRKLDRAIIVVLLLAVGYFALDKFVLTGDMDAAPPTATQPDTAAVTGSAVEPVSPAPPPDRRKSIVVLPFVNMSADPDQEYFSDGLSEELLNVLAKIRGLRVISRTSAFAFKGKEVSIPDIAAQLDVSHVLEGSVRSAGDSVRITAQLIEVETDSHLWSEAYNRKLENIFEIQEEISAAIARALQVTLGAGIAQDRPTDNLEAYQLFLRGRHHYQNRGREEMSRAVETLQRAVEMDPGFAEAWANLAAASAVQSYYLEEGHEVLAEQAEQAALRAIEIDPGNGFAHAVLGLHHTRDLNWEDSIRELRLAIELNPNESNSLLWIAITLSELGYIQEALAYLKQAETFDPVFSNLQNWLAMLYHCIGDHETALIHEQKARQANPYFGLNTAGEYALVSGDLDRAEAETLLAAEMDNGNAVVVRAFFSALRDPARRDEAIATLQANEARSGYNGVFTLLYRLGAVPEAIGAWHRLRERGRALRAANTLQSLWNAYDRPQLSHPALPAFFEETGMADYWRAHGEPDYCRVNGPDIVCGGP